MAEAFLDNSENISIHSLRMEGDTYISPRENFSQAFQSTPSAWRETFLPPTFRSAISISIHSLRMEGDPEIQCDITLDTEFQSTPSAWRETYVAECSIPETEEFQSTPSAWRETSGILSSIVPDVHFNPLPPHGGRREDSDAAANMQIISIHSLRMEGDAAGLTAATEESKISIHSLRMEGDSACTLAG